MIYVVTMGDTPYKKKCISMRFSNRSDAAKYMDNELTSIVGVFEGKEISDEVMMEKYGKPWEHKVECEYKKAHHNGL